MSEATKKLRDFLTISPSVVYPDEVLELLEPIERENAELRQLVRDMWHDMPKSESCGWDMDANNCTGSDECRGECAFWYRMRELGVYIQND